MKIKGLSKAGGMAAALAVAAPLVLGGSAAPAVAAGAQTAASCGTSVARLDAVTYADRLVRAWGRGDTRMTACYGTTEVTRALFAQASPGGIHWRRVSAEGAAGTIYVTYHDDARGGNLTLGVANAAPELRGPGGWHAARVVSLANEPRAWNAVQWSDNLVRAWGRGDTKWMSYYATPAVTKALTQISASGGPSWRRIATEGAAGTTYLTYRNDANGHQLVVGISNIGLSQGDAHVAYRIQYR
ncbi:hypothetical protein AB0I34_04470 [Kribbella sp. NPDC050281]|uniref:hypothetical protein n=1 Tax=Kribbella sp. NPDC050281 TaxID=3155515 RepID=UPI0033CAA19D